MKELSIEEKAKAYDELIKRLNKAREDVGGYTFKSVYDEVMSELAESEDEKFLRYLIDCCKDTIESDDKGLELSMVTTKRLFAWLEKQGEKGINGKNREIPFSEQKPNPCGNCGIATNNCQNFPCVIRDGEQNPADKVEPKFKKGDVVRLKDGDGLEWTVENVHKNGYYTIVNSYRDDFILLDDKWELVEQNPTWSEEDDDNLSWLVEMLLGFDGNDIECYKDKKFIDKCKEVCKWLKAIKDRTFPQPKQEEWTEDDENKVTLFMQLVEGCDNYEELSNWLKFLKNRVGCAIHFTTTKEWKPSDEQMEILDMVLTNESMDDNVARILRELREQLKKLREG